MKIVFLDSDTMGDVSFAPIAEKGELILYPRSTPQQAIERVKDCEVLIVNKIIVNKELVDAAPKLRLICEAATGVNNIDIEYARSKGIPVRNAAGYSTESVAQVTFMHILNLVGHASYFDRRVKTGEYYENGIFSDMSWPFFELKGKKLGIIGMGRIGQSVARKAAAFGMRVIYYNRHRLPAEKESELHAEYMPLDGLLQKSDIITLHTPYTPESHHIIDSRALSLMKPTAILVNTARGACVDEQALVKHLADGKIWGATLDVYEHEPQVSPELYKMDNVLLSPHVGTATVECRQAMAQCVCDNIHAFISGQYERMDWVNKF